MRIFRKRKKFGNFRGAPEDAGPLPDIVYQMGAEAAVAQYAAERAMPPNPYGGIDSFEQEGVYGYPHVPIPAEEEFDERARASSPFRFMASALGIGRSKSRERRAHRPVERSIEVGSPVHFQGRPPGTPVKYRRRPASPEILHPRASSPFHFAQQERVPSPYHFARQERVPSPLHFAQQSRPGSPDVMRRLQRAHLSQDLQRIEKQQRREQEMMMMDPVQYLPQYQQPYHPNGYMQGYPPMQQQPQMYSYY